MGMYDRDWYRNERRNSRQQHQSTHHQLEPANASAGPPGFTSAAAIGSFVVGLIVAALIFAFV